MTIAELAQKLNITVLEFFEHYKNILVEIPQDENYVLTTEQIKRTIPKDEAEERTEEIKYESALTQFEDLNSKLKELKTKQIEILNKVEPYFKIKDADLLKKIKKHNSIPDFIFQGDFKKIEGMNFGFFKNISHQNGTPLTYPVFNDPIDEIFIPTSELLNGKRYFYEVTIAKKYERINKQNPFLLQAKSDNIKEIIELSAISEELKAKEEKLKDIYTNLEKAEEDFEETKSEIEERISKILQERQAEVNSIIEEYQDTINQKFYEIQDKEDKLTSLNESVETRNNQLQKMENILKTLKDRVSLCRNLQFISKDDENKYLSLLTSKEYKPVNHLDFEDDFEKSFSNLIEHIHTYLFRKKNLIYTQYQIKNFLILLRTHDLIVLSGLSGSGKTQIVKAFAEALGGIAKIIPVKPNWTSSDDLTGYYNPLQMSFLPTPFTEAIIEAISNPNQLYFICLDEMNLARVEYYFADFLSKLEERNQQPEIELYAKHEEELFVSEFNTLLNLIESSVKGKEIKSWQDFLDNEEARKKFFEMLGNTDKESILQIHAKMKRRLIDILKFPSTIRIPENVRFIGAINVDETTHYFSPKILDRIHVVKFDNPLLFEEQVSNWFKYGYYRDERELLPVYIRPDLFSKREDYPPMNDEGLEFVEEHLKRINKEFLLPLKIDFGIRSIRQCLNYYNIAKCDEEIIYTEYNIDGSEYKRKYSIEYPDTLQILNTLIIQKILPRFIFDGNENTNIGKTKSEVVDDFCNYLKDKITNYMTYDSDGAPMDDVGIEIKISAYRYLNEMIKISKLNNLQFNFFA